MKGYLKIRSREDRNGNTNQVDYAVKMDNVRDSDIQDVLENICYLFEISLSEAIELLRNIDEEESK